MNVSLAQRCVHHPAREAVVRCPECRRFFCRECVSEHDDRMLCARCLAQGVLVQARTPSRFAVLRITGAILGIFVAWWFFDLVGRGLILLPASVHEGTIWQNANSGDDD